MGSSLLYECVSRFRDLFWVPGMDMDRTGELVGN